MLAVLLAIVVGTWNGNWFPSGRAEHRAHPDVEAATINAAAKMLADGLAKADPDGTNDVILVLNEIRGPRVASNLVARIGRKGLVVASVSGYRRRDRYDQQQDVIATTLPVADRGWSVWKQAARETPPRGYAYAALVVAPSVTTRVYAVHLKSNFRAGSDEVKRLNRIKRTRSIEELVARERGSGSVIIAGDFNADPWKREFAEDSMFRTLESAGFSNVLTLLPKDGRGTHPNRRYGDSALDHIMYIGFDAKGAFLMPNDELSDHLAVFANLLQR